MSTSTLEWPIADCDHTASVRTMTTPDGGWNVDLVFDGQVIAHARYWDWHRVERFRARARTLVLARARGASNNHRRVA